MNSPIASTEASSSLDPIHVEPAGRNRAKGIIARRFSAVALVAVLLPEEPSRIHLHMHRKARQCAAQDGSLLASFRS